MSSQKRKHDNASSEAKSVDNLNLTNTTMVTNSIPDNSNLINVTPLVDLDSKIKKDTNHSSSSKNWEIDPNGYYPKWMDEYLTSSSSESYDDTNVYYPKWMDKYLTSNSSSNSSSSSSSSSE